MSPPRPATSRPPGTVQAWTAPSSSIENIERELEALPRYYRGENVLSQLLQGYFRQARIRSNFRFGRTEIVVDDSPDLQVKEGAEILAWTRIQNGRVSIPQPFRLQGFYAVGGFYNFCSVDSDSAGGVHLKSCPFSLPKDSDISEPALKGPLAALFPEKRIHPVELSDLTKALAAPQAAGSSGGDDPLLSSLRSIHLKAQIPGELWIDDPWELPGTPLNPLNASLEAYLDVPALRKNLAEGLWRSLDFSGLERGSKVLWPRFDLSVLPLPEGWSIPEGRADIELRHFPEAGKTELQIRKLKARAKISPLFGEAELNLEGGAKLTLHRGGAIDLDLLDLRVEAPLHSMDSGALPNLSVILAGSIRGSDVKLSLSDFQIQVPEGKSSPLGESGLSWRGSLLGQGELEYQADASVLKRLELELSGDLALLKADGSVVLEAEGLGIDLRGNAESLKLKGDAVSLNYGASSLRPDFSFEVKLPQKSGGGHLEASGDLQLKGINIPLNLVAALDLKAKDQKGELKIGPLSLGYGGKDLTRKARAKLSWSEKGLEGQVHLPDLPGGNALDLRLRGAGDSGRLNGSFTLKPAKIQLSPELSAEDLRISGTFGTQDWATLFAKPRMSLNTQVSGKLAGSIRGPFSAELHGSLSYSPAHRSIYLWLNPRSDSVLQVGPLAMPGESRPIEAELPLKGTWQAVLLPRGVLIGGRGVGFEGGELRIGEGPSKTKAIGGLTLIADQLWSVRNGIAYAGGDGIRIEGQVDTSVFLGSEVQGLGSRKVFLISDQLPLSVEAYWQLFGKSLRTEGGR